MADQKMTSVIEPALKPVERQLLALVRAALWQQQVDEAAFQADTTDWPAIGRLALQQTVGSMAFEAAAGLPDKQLPPEEWLGKARAFTRTNILTGILADSCVAEAVARLRDEGIRASLLKGQAYAHVYPAPHLRQCGDIDLYVGGDDYRRAYEATRKFGWESTETFSPGSKHYACDMKGVRIELHRKAAILDSASLDRRFDLWSRDELTLSGRTVCIAGTDIPVPTPTFDVVFVFLHLYHHFINGGIGLRHICDWAMLLHAHADEIDPTRLEDRLKELKLMRAWRSFAPIAVVQLGLPESECPFFSRKYENRSGRILSAILKEGNFGRANQGQSSRPEGYFAGKLYSLRQTGRNHLNKFRIDPASVIRSFRRTLLIGISQVLKDMMNRKDR